MAERDAFGQHPGREGERRIDDIVSRMTVPELVGQMVGMPPSADVDEVIEAVREHHIGSVHFGGTPHNTPAAKAAFANEVQEAAVEASRFDVPLFLRAMAEHGHAAVAGSTVFPQQLALGATRNPDLAERTAAAAATEMRATGVHSTSSPIGDVARDQRWGRITETFSESPRLCGDLTAAMVEGYQTGADPVFAVTKHFPAYSEMTRGEDQAPNEISEYTLRRVHVPPYAAGIDAGTAGVMPCYNAIDGEPVHGSRRFLDDLLRDDLGFEGFVLADYRAPDDLHGGHNTSGSLEESLWQLVRAGVDVLPAGGPAYATRLVDLVREGELSEERVAESARRVLRLKVSLGLFEDPTVDESAAESTLGSHRELAREAARQSMTLLTNDGLLPLDAPDSVFVGGPNADDIDHQHGGWGHTGEPRPLGDTVLDGMREVAPDGTEITHEQGTTINETLDVEAAASAAANADVAVLALGEPAYVHEFRQATEGSGPDSFPRRSQLRLPDAQRELAEAVHVTGTPTVGVLVTGRVLSTPWLADNLDALLMAYQPGSAGGAVADTLFGDCDPAGRLPVSVPRSTGHLPTRFNHLSYPTIENEAHEDAYDPLFPYGHGLSYTDFEYRNLALSEAEIGPDGSVEVRVTVENVGERAGVAVPEVFVNDVRSSRVTPVRELAGHGRLELAPGESGTVTVEIGREELGVMGNDGRREVEPGAFEIMVQDLSETLTVSRRRPY